MSLSHLHPKGRLCNGQLPSSVGNSVLLPGSDVTNMLFDARGGKASNSLNNAHSMLVGEDRATQECDPSAPTSPSRGTHRGRIIDYLRSHGPAGMTAIARATGIRRDMVNLTLSNGKGKCFVHYPDRRVWGVKPARECSICEGTEFWLRADGAMVCSHCN